MTLRLPPGMTRPAIPPNPDPTRVTQEMWEFANLVISLEPNDFVFAGIYADKSGYHNTVARNLSRWPGEYSSRLAADLNGDRTKARAVDIKSKQAASGAKPTIMAKYGARMRAAARARDPRVRHWREVLGQFDTDTPPEAIDFQSVVERQPDDTHEWHFHWSILALYVALRYAYEGMLSVLYGEDEASWNRYAATGGDADMQLSDKEPFGSKPSQFTREDEDPALWLMNGPNGSVGAMFQYMLENGHFARIFARRAAMETAGMRAVVETLADVIKSGGGDVDTAGLFARIDAAVAKAGAEARDAVADALEGGAPKVRADADE